MLMRRAIDTSLAVSLLLALLAAFAPPSNAAWVNNTGTQFQVGNTLLQIVPNNVGTNFADPTCGSQGGTSLALVPSLLQGLTLTGVDPVANPLVLVVSCLDNGGSTAVRARLNIIKPGDGKVVAQISTNPVQTTGFPHFGFRPDKGDLLGCGENGALYTIGFLKATGTPPTAPVGQLTLATQVAQQVTSCK